MTQVDQFVVAWDDPADAGRTWARDVMHAPEPLQPLSGMFATLVGHGLNHAMRHYSIPIAETKYRTVNGYLYSTMIPFDVPREELERLAAEAQTKVTGVLPSLWDLWENSYLPEIKTLLAELEAFDLDGSSIGSLVSHWDRVVEIERRFFEIHFLVLMPSMLAVSEFDELYRGLTQSDDPYAAYRLLQGQDNMTLETGRALFELSRSIVGDDDIEDILKTHDGAEALDALEATEKGRTFGADLRRYLDEYGQRGDQWDVSYPSWIEDPTPVINNLRMYVGCDTHPASELEQAAVEAERLVGEARERLKDEPMLPIFEFLLKAAREGIVISEDHGFWIDFRGGHRFRMACLAFGRRFVEAGVMEDANDVFHLFPEEVIETALVLPDVDRRALVAERAEDLKRWAAMPAPATIGAPPVPDPTLDENPLSRAFGKFFGARVEPPIASGEFAGNPASPGTARGTARIIRTIVDADRLEPGDVLVAETTSPPWTPLFAFASAVVCETGGILSHAAVVAREYQIPAVLGVVGATTDILDGQTVEVDGDTGTVRVVV